MNSLANKLSPSNNSNIVKLSHFENILNYIGHLKQDKFSTYNYKIFERVYNYSEIIKNIAEEIANACIEDNLGFKIFQKYEKNGEIKI